MDGINGVPGKYQVVGPTAQATSPVSLSFSDICSHVGKVSDTMQIHRLASTRSIRRYERPMVLSLRMDIPQTLISKDEDDRTRRFGV